MNFSASFVDGAYFIVFLSSEIKLNKVGVTFLPSVSRFWRLEFNFFREKEK